ncbi:MAG: S-layer homology domain-containing protein, partial [Clostridia bacterium]|nr:S-layer homology domain-containing protein [Clostridia bacterium]
MKNKLIILLTVLALMLTQTGVFAIEEAVNVALYQTAEASSQVDESHPAELANDGINDNEAYTWWQSAGTDKAAWWQVDLGLAYKLATIELEAKIGGDVAERKNFRVLASNEKDFSESVELATVGDEDYGTVFSLEIAKKEKFRFIRIEKTNQSALSIGELRVFANKAEIKQGAEAVSITGQIPQTGAEGRYVLPADVIGTPYEKAVALLSALNIMRGYPDGDFMPGESITRAEFATVISRILGGAVASSNRSFDDVRPDHWAYDAIETAAGLGIVQGVEPAIFKPDSTVTTPQVIKMLVSALGYGETAEAQGGYPTGYQNMAIKLELYEGVTLKDGEDITRGEIAQLVYNALECDIMRVMGTDEFTTGMAYSGQTVLTEYLHLNKGKGIVTGVSGTSLTNVNRIKDATYLEIGGKAYYSEIPNLEAYLGYHVEFYYDKDEVDEPEVVALLITNRNHTLTLDASELIEIKNMVLTYGLEDEEEAELSEDMDVIYNGVARRVYDYADLLPESGQVTLIDNNGDSSYDVYIVQAIKNYVVSWVNVNKKMVYTKDAAGSLSLDVTEDRISIVDKSTGKDVQLDALQEWNILSVMESVNTEGQKCYKVIVSNEFIRGELEEKDETYLTIAGRRVEVAENFDADALEVGAKGFFYLDGVGKLAAFNGDATPGEQYGFLRAAKESSGLDRKLELRIFTNQGKFETFALSKTFSLNGNTNLTNAEILESLLESGMNETEAQPVE